MASQIDLGAVVPIGKGDWNSSTIYERTNIVRHNSTAWICKVATSTGVEPSEDSSDWYLLVKDTSSVTSVNGMKGDVVVDTSTADKLTTARKITLTGPITGTANFDGSTDINIPTTIVEASTNTKGVVQLSSDINSTSTAMAATASAVKTAYDKAVEAQTGCLPLTGGTVTGSIHLSNGGEVGGLACSNINSEYRYIVLTALGTNAGSFQAFRQDSPVLGGAFICRAMDANGNFFDLVGKNDGTLTWRDSPVLLPPGAVFAFAANSAPAGCLICNGAAVSRTTYADLFAVIGGTFGLGDGSTTFNLPNLTNRFIQGSEIAGTYIEAGLPNITGGVAIPGLSHGDGGNYVGALYYQNAGARNGALQSPDVGRVNIGIDASRANGIYGASITVQPPAVTMRYFIKY